MDLLGRTESLFTDYVIAPLDAVIFFDVAFWDPDVTIPIVVLWLVLAALFFTLRFQFVNFRAFRHAVDCVRGRYTDPGAKGEISHFQALSGALSATVGLGNIAGVAIAISLGGPGAVFWMWLVGLVGMCLKMTEVTQSMMYRNLDDPENPHGGPMWVVKKGFAKFKVPFRYIGPPLGVIFCLTLLVSTVTGGNMFQAWNVADISFEYFGIPKIVTGIILTVGVGLVIVGGIKRIGDVAGRVVPFMCAIYVLAGLAVILMRFDEIPAMFALIFREAFSPSEATGAFLGGTAGYGFLKGMQRALFSNEAGQGSAPIAHSAAKTDEPVREGIVAGIGPFVDTLCVCTITALVILLSGVWNRQPALAFEGGGPAITQALDDRGAPLEDESGVYLWEIAPTRVTVRDAAEATGQMRDGKDIFVVLDAGKNSATGMRRHRLSGTLVANEDGSFSAVFDGMLASADNLTPTVTDGGAYFGYKGATLTAKAYDRTLPGLGKWIVPGTAWLFAFSTMISWSYYGEQGIVFLMGLRAVASYRIVYCLLILVTTLLVRTETQLDILSTLGTGVMLWANIPIMLIFGPKAMRAFHDYFRRLKSGEMDPPHAAPPITDVVEGRDVE
jgi:AGCS family alanine or glycine:cation symporter